MTAIKVCGFVDADNAAAVAAIGVEYVGLNFWPRSKRYVTVERATQIAAAIRASGPTAIVGVFVDAAADEIAATVRAVGLDVVQLHGDESPGTVDLVAGLTSKPVWKAFPIRERADLDRIEPYVERPPKDPHHEGWGNGPRVAEALLLDTATAERGGSGLAFDWAIARDASQIMRTPIVLAGGLRPETVASAIATAAPWAVDVASGVESAPGVKDLARVAAFVAAVRGN